MRIDVEAESVLNVDGMHCSVSCLSFLSLNVVFLSMLDLVFVLSLWYQVYYLLGIPGKARPEAFPEPGLGAIAIVTLS